MRELRYILAALVGLAFFAGVTLEWRSSPRVVTLEVADCAGLKLHVIEPAHALGPGVHGGGYPCAGSTSYTLSGPATGDINQALTYTVTPVGTLSSGVTVTPADGGKHGTFTPSSVVISGSSPATFIYKPYVTGSISIATTNSGSLTNPSPAALAVANLAPAYPNFATGWSTSTGTLNPSVGDPFSGSNAASLTENTGNSQHSLLSSSFAVTPNQTYAVGVLAKEGTGTRNLALGLDESVGFTANFSALFNLGTCTFVSDQSNAGTLTGTATLSIFGWCLVIETGTLGNFSSAAAVLYAFNGGSFSYLGDGVSTIDIYGAFVQ